MPRIGKDLWKVGLSFFWYREYQDGRIEQEFDLDTGQIRLWGSETPNDLKRVGWLPMTADLAQKIRAYGEIGIPTQAQSVLIDLKPREELSCFKDCTVLQGFRVTCKACGATYHALADPDICPRCGAKPAWRCEKCGQLQDTETCPNCNQISRAVTPFVKHPDAWEDVVYVLGINGRFLIKFNSNSLVVEH